jgi:hypothetical protein
MLPIRRRRRRVVPRSTSSTDSDMTVASEHLREERQAERNDRIAGNLDIMEANVVRGRLEGRRNAIVGTRSLERERRNQRRNQRLEEAIRDIEILNMGREDLRVIDPVLQNSRSNSSVMRDIEILNMGREDLRVIHPLLQNSRSNSSLSSLMLRSNSSISDISHSNGYGDSIAAMSPLGSIRTRSSLGTLESVSSSEVSSLRNSEL